MRTRPSSGVRKRWRGPSRWSIRPVWRAQLIATVLSQHRRDVAATQADAEALMALATVQGFEHRVAQGRMLGVGAGHARGRGHRYGAHPTGDGSGADYRSEAEPPLSPWLPSGGVWPGRAARGRAVGAGRGLDAGGGDRGAVVGSGGVSAQGGVAPPAPSQISPRRPPVSTRPSTWPAASRPRRWSCVPR